MREIINSIAVPLIFFGCLYFLMHVFTYGFANPQTIKVDDIYIKIPNMHIQTIFGGIEADSKTFLELIFEKNIYEINYPQTEMISIIFRGGAKGAMVSLIPILTKQNLYTFSESNITREFKNCIFSINDKIVYNHINMHIVDEVKKQGYGVSSEDNLTNLLIMKQLCN